MQCVLKMKRIAMIFFVNSEYFKFVEKNPIKNLILNDRRTI